MTKRILREDECRELLRKNLIGHLATCGEDREPYIIPVNYIYFQDSIYFHTGFNGKKIENIHANPKVCFEVSKLLKLEFSAKSCKSSAHYWSVLIFGTAKEIDDNPLKIEVLNEMMKRHFPQKKFDSLSNEDINTVNIIEIAIDRITGKTNL